MSVSSISESDRVLLRELQLNARITNRELAKAAGIAESTCLDRVRSLQQRGVIQGFHADLNLPAIGRTLRALITVRLQPKTTDSVHEFQQDILGAPESLSITTVTGADDFIVAVCVAGVSDLRRFVLEHITSRPDVIDARTSIVYEYLRKLVIEPTDAPTDAPDDDIVDDIVGH